MCKELINAPSINNNQVNIQTETLELCYLNRMIRVKWFGYRYLFFVTVTVYLPDLKMIKMFLMRSWVVL